MDSNSLVVLVSVLGTLAAVSALGGTALLVGAYVNQRARLIAADARLAEQAKALAAADEELKKFRRARRNKLYQGAMEEYGFAARQSIIRLRALRAEIDSEFLVMEKMLDLAPKGTTK